MKKNNTLEIHEITKQYAKGTGISRISFTVNAGEIVALIGPNGAGKTTLMKAVGGLCRLSGGEALLNNVPTFQCRENLGFMQEALDFYEKMTVYEALDFLCAVKFRGGCREEIDHYLKAYQLFEQRNLRISRLSLGMKRKLSLIMALMGDCPLLLLDVPTNGIDTAGLIQLKRDLLRRRDQNGITLFTSHVLDWAEHVCSRCIFLKTGEIAADCRMEEMHPPLEKLYENLYFID